ncbi:uncharacterized protein LTR77_007235 [Saxophila tyrrhenica]|uniref:Ubiquitin-like domain-containing protein n=1 Tax=Saxophila tyrrhenica TaxID=1690608 RepID=A0AAV9P473_9PEZI|nr:hypothetical protein LTR77_007235 [Saxophila tyrrhenica]
MSEVTFAKSFLATLDKRPIKLPADHVSDPRKYPNQSPFILPRQTHPFPRRSPTTTTPAKTLTATLKPMRAGSGSPVTLADLDANTTIHDLKAQYASQTGQAVEKIKLLLNKKPAADLKTLKELGVKGDVEFSVMLMGGGGGTPGATTPAVEKGEPVLGEKAEKIDVDSQGPAPESEKAMAEAVESKAEGEGVDGILKTEEFWGDLKGFLAQRLRDEKEGEKLVGVFREAWKSS